MPDPIPDEVLWAALLPNGDDGAWMIGPPTRLISELLALRRAAKFAWGGLKDIEEGRDGPGEKWCAEACRNIEALLPKEPA